MEGSGVCPEHVIPPQNEIAAQLAKVDPSVVAGIENIFAELCYNFLLALERQLAEGEEVLLDKIDHMNIVLQAILDKLESLCASNIVYTYMLSQLFLKTFSEVLS